MKKLTLSTIAILGIAALTASAQVLNVWNVNFAGNESTGSVIEVPDGTVLTPGSVGGNQWNNIAAPMRDPYVPAQPLGIADANGANSISLTWIEEGDAGHHFSRTVGIPEENSELFQAYFGVGGFNTTLQMSGIDAGIYDVYAYFTWGWNDQFPVDYSITTGFGDVLSKTVNPNGDDARPTATHDDMLEGFNFVVFEGITPDAGAIDLNVFSTNGGISGFQLVQVPEPSTYAAILGALFLAFAIWRRRR